MNRCGICKRHIIPWQVFNWAPAWFAPIRLLHGRMDCGGDCRDCVEGAEQL